jgi:hypothetical protein
MRSAKVMANAFRAGFHRIAHRVCPVPLGSSDRTTRYSVYGRPAHRQTVRQLADRLRPLHQPLHDGAAGLFGQGAPPLVHSVSRH